MKIKKSNQAIFCLNKNLTAEVKFSKFKDSLLHTSFTGTAMLQSVVKVQNLRRVTVHSGLGPIPVVMCLFIAL